MIKSNKKGVELPSSKSILLFIMIIVIIIIISMWPSKLADSTISGTLSAKFTAKCEERYSVSSYTDPMCIVKNCDEGMGCTEEEEKLWQQQLAFLGGKDCDCNKDDDDCDDVEKNNICTGFQYKIFDCEENNKCGVSVSELTEDVLNKLKDVDPTKILDVEEDLKKTSSDVSTVISKLKALQLDVGMNAYDYLISYSINKGLNPILSLAVITQESSGDPSAVSVTGAAGLTQFTSGTASRYPNIFQKITPCCTKSEAEKRICNTPSVQKCNSENDDRFNPRKAIEAQVELLSSLSQKYSGNIILILTAYNAGESVADKCKDISDETEMISCIKTKTFEIYGGNSKVTEVTGYIEKITSNMVS